MKATASRDSVRVVILLVVLFATPAPVLGGTIAEACNAVLRLVRPIRSAPSFTEATSAPPGFFRSLLSGRTVSKPEDAIPNRLLAGVAERLGADSGVPLPAAHDVEGIIRLVGRLLTDHADDKELVGLAARLMAQVDHPLRTVSIRNRDQTFERFIYGVRAQVRAAVTAHGGNGETAQAALKAASVATRELLWSVTTAPSLVAGGRAGGTPSTRLLALLTERDATHSRWLDGTADVTAVAAIDGNITRELLRISVEQHNPHAFFNAATRLAAMAPGTDRAAMRRAFEAAIAGLTATERTTFDRLIGLADRFHATQPLAFPSSVGVGFRCFVGEMVSRIASDEFRETTRERGITGIGSSMGGTLVPVPDQGFRRPSHAEMAERMLGERYFVIVNLKDREVLAEYRALAAALRTARAGGAVPSAYRAIVAQLARDRRTIPDFVGTVDVFGGRSFRDEFPTMLRYVLVEEALRGNVARAPSPP